MYIVSVTLGSLTSGLLFTWPTQSIPILLQEGISLEMASYVTVFPPIALILSSPIFAYLLDKIGRKGILILVAIPQFLAWIITAQAESIYTFYIARIMNGISDASYYTVVPAYIAEIATPKVRGTWGNALTFLVYVGNLLAIVVGYNFNIKTTAYIFSLIPVIFLIGILIIPETPYYLIMKKNDIAAMESLKWLRRKINVENEFKQLTQDVNRQLSESGSVKDLFLIASNRKALTTAAFLRGAQQFSGSSALAVYAQIIFSQNGGFISASYSSMIFIGLMVVANFGAAFILDKLGRRRAMIISCLGCAVLMTIESIYFYLNLVDMAWLPIVGLSVYVLFFSIGLGIMPSLMLGELFSSSVKGKSLCVTNIFFGLFLGGCTKLFQFLMTTYGMDFAFGFFACCCFVSSAASFYFVPETKGKTLEEIQQTLKTS